MRVTVRFYGVTHEAVRDRSTCFDVPESTTLGEFLRMLARSHGGRLEEFIFDREGRLSTSVNLAVGGNILSPVDRAVLQRQLKEIAGDDSPEVSLVIIPPIFGGEIPC